ncbi:MAG: hypothetical protein J5856_00250 [Lachnospiraceae bacterium]|nr:hypothetical protein [Lachnospiraceae bacterium]
MMIKRAISIFLTVSFALTLCACELPGGSVPIEGKGAGAKKANLPIIVEAVEPEPAPKEKVEYLSDTNRLNIVVPDDYGKNLIFSQDDHAAKNPYKEYSHEQLLEASEAYFEHMESFTEAGWKVDFMFGFITNDNLPELIYMVYIGDRQMEFEYHFCSYDFDKAEVAEIGSFISNYDSICFNDYGNLLWFYDFDSGYTSLIEYYVTVNDEYRFELVGTLQSEYFYEYDSEGYFVNGQASDYATYAANRDAYYGVSDYSEVCTYGYEPWISLKGPNEYEHFDEYDIYEEGCEMTILDDLHDILVSYPKEKKYTFFYLDEDYIPEMLVLQDYPTKDNVMVYNANFFWSEDDIYGYVTMRFSGVVSDELSYSKYNNIFKTHTDLGEVETTEFMSLFDYYMSSPVQTFVADRATVKGETHYYLNGCELTENRYFYFLNRWQDMEFTELPFDNMYTETDEESLKKHYLAALSEYDYKPETEYESSIP